MVSLVWFTVTLSDFFVPAMVNEVFPLYRAPTPVSETPLSRDREHSTSVPAVLAVVSNDAQLDSGNVSLKLRSNDGS